MLRQCTNRDRGVLNDVADTETVTTNRTKAKETERRVTTVGSREDGIVQLIPTGVGKDFRQLLEVLFLWDVVPDDGFVRFQIRVLVLFREVALPDAEECKQVSVHTLALRTPACLLRVLLTRFQ